jgi:hypothetical protein
MLKPLSATPVRRGSDNALNGCINDAKCMQYLLKTKFGFREEDITMLLDDSPSSSMWPTGANMRAHMQRLVAGAQPGDSLVFHFSGGLHFQHCKSSDHPCWRRTAGRIAPAPLLRRAGSLLGFTESQGCKKQCAAPHAAVSVLV